MEAEKLQPHTDTAVRAVLPCVMQQMESQNPGCWTGGLELDALKSHRQRNLRPREDPAYR